MSFVGIVHRKEQDVGVTLQAKVLSPNKLKATTKNYKVTIKGTPTSLYERALQDVTYAKNTLLANLAYDTSDVSATFGTFIPNQGPNGSTITFSVENGKGFPFTEVFDQTGRFVARPGVGDATSEGNIRFVATITENGVTETVETNLKLSCDPMSPDIFYEMFGPEDIWNIIKGSNTAKDFITGDLSLGSGGNRVIDGSVASDRALLGSASVGRNAKVKLHFVVVDEIPSMEDADIKAALWDSSRFSAAGVLTTATRQSYKNAYAAFNTNTNSEDHVRYLELGNRLDPNNASATQYYVRYKGLSVTCNVSFLDSNDDPIASIESHDYVVSNMATISNFLTNQEVMDEVIKSNDFKLSFATTDQTKISTGNDSISFINLETATLQEKGATPIDLSHYVSSETDETSVSASVFTKNTNAAGSGTQVNLNAIFGNVPIEFTLSKFESTPIAGTIGYLYPYDGSGENPADLGAAIGNFFTSYAAASEDSSVSTLGINAKTFITAYNTDIAAELPDSSAGKKIMFKISLNVSKYYSESGTSAQKDYYALARFKYSA